MYAVLETGSKQYRVAAGDRLEIERLAIEAGQPVTFDRVLMLNNDGKVTLGSPTVPSATVVAEVVEHIRGEKKVAFKMKRREGYHKTIGHRQELTVVKIKEIQTGVGGPAEQKAAAETPQIETQSTANPEPPPADSQLSTPPP